MSILRVRLHPEAKEELADAAVWYERRRAGLGQEFRSAVRSAARIVGENPNAWSVSEYESSVRVFTLRRFPFLLPYTVEAKSVVILAVAHAKRRPGYWRSRL